MPQAFCRNPSGQKSRRADRIVLQASRAVAVRAVSRTVARTTAQRRDEIGRTAWKTKTGTVNVAARARKESSRVPVAALLYRPLAFRFETHPMSASYGEAAMPAR